MADHPSAQFENALHLIFFLGLQLFAMLNSGLNVLGQCVDIAGLSHSGTGGAQEEDGVRSLACAYWK